MFGIKKPYTPPENTIPVDAAEYTRLRKVALEYSLIKGVPLEKLTMKQLGSYIPDFTVLEDQTEDLKNSLGQLCSNILKNPSWTYLMRHMKQDQVQKAFFTEGVEISDPFIRGSINGIYSVEDQVQMLANYFDDRAQKRMVKK